ARYDAETAGRKGGSRAADPKGPTRAAWRGAAPRSATPPHSARTRRRRRRRAPPGRAHHGVHGGLPGLHRAVRLGRDLVATGSRPPHAKRHHADGPRRDRAGARAGDAPPRGLAERFDGGRDRRGAPPLRGLLRRTGRERRLRDRAAGDRRGGDAVTRAVVLSAVRTPVGRYGGGLASVRPDDLAALAVAAGVERAGVPPDEIEDVWLGCANQPGEDNRNVARFAALLAGLPDSVAGVTVNRLRASGLSAIIRACHAAIAGDGDLFVAGDVESMTRAPLVTAKPDAPFARGNRTVYD